MTEPRILFVRGARGVEDISGAESLIFTLMRGLQALGCACRVVFLIRSAQEGAPWLETVRGSGLEHEFVHVERPWSLADVRTLPRIVRRFRADVVHPVDHRADVAGLLAARLTGRAAVATYTGWTNWDAGFRRGPLYEWADRQALGRMDAVLADSRFHGRTLGLGPGDAPLVVVPNGVDIGRFDPVGIGPGLRERIFGPEAGDLVTVGMVGRVHPVKGQRELVLAAERLVGRHPGLRVLIVGDPTRGFESYRDEVEALVRERGLEHVVRLTNFSHREIPGVIAALDIVAAPSFIEGISFSILEGMAMGKALVASTAGGTPEVLADGETGLLVPPGDVGALAGALERAIGSRELRNELGGRARARIERDYTVEVMARRTLRLYREVLAWRGAQLGRAGPRSALRTRIAEAGLAML